jgi:hypothetical protein
MHYKYFVDWLYFQNKEIGKKNYVFYLVFLILIKSKVYPLLISKL